MNTFKKIVASLFVALIAGVAYGQMSHEGMMDMEAMQGMVMDMMPKESDAESTRAFKEADMKMMHNMAVPYTGDPDIDFRTKMISHHRGAIDMAKVALQYAKDPETKAMAEAIIEAQEKEIAEMQAWLAANKK
jgi:uncharacterized protein (DUF305 family)